MSEFRERVLRVVREIPAGSVMTYGEVAALSGRPGAARAVGSIMRANFDPTIPCHRVIRSDGRVGEYNRGGSAAKMAILRTEGVKL